MRSVCYILGHRRSVKRATKNYEADRWESVCKYCGMPMVRINHHDWRPKSQLGETKGAETV